MGLVDSVAGQCHSETVGLTTMLLRLSEIALISLMVIQRLQCWNGLMGIVLQPQHFLGHSSHVL